MMHPPQPLAARPPTTSQERQAAHVQSLLLDASTGRLTANAAGEALQRMQLAPDSEQALQLQGSGEHSCAIVHSSVEAVVLAKLCVLDGVQAALAGGPVPKAVEQLCKALVHAADEAGPLLGCFKSATLYHMLSLCLHALAGQPGLADTLSTYTKYLLQFHATVPRLAPDEWLSPQGEAGVGPALWPSDAQPDETAKDYVARCHAAAHDALQAAMRAASQTPSQPSAASPASFLIETEGWLPRHVRDQLRRRLLVGSSAALHLLPSVQQCRDKVCVCVCVLPA